MEIYIRNILLLHVILFNITTAQVSEYSGCECGSESELKNYLNEGYIPEIFLADINVDSYQNWSSSILCPSGQLPKSQLLLNEETDYSDLVHAEWSCMYSAYSAMDGDSSTTWSEGVMGDGSGEIVLVQLDIYRQIEIWAGFGKSERLFLANNRPKKIKLYYLITNDFPEAVQNGVGFKNIRLIDSQETELLDKNGFQSIPHLLHGSNSEENITGFLAIEILSVYKGEKYNDTCISEIRNSP